LLTRIQKLVAPISLEQDAKLQKLKEKLDHTPLKKGKRLIFSQYADTARYLSDNLNPNGKRDGIDTRLRRRAIRASSFHARGSCQCASEKNRRAAAPPQTRWPMRFAQSSA
jgi:hypothetical protein